jgi:hypothetical protein
MIALCVVLSGGRTAVDMAVFAEAKQDFLGRFLRLKNGVPNHDTFSRVFSRLDPDLFRRCFQKFVTRFGKTGSGRHRDRRKDPAPNFRLVSYALRSAHGQRLKLRQSPDARAGGRRR